MLDHTSTTEFNRIAQTNLDVDVVQAFVILKGALAFFTFNNEGAVTCTVINDVSAGSDRVIIVEKGQWHAMTAAPVSMGWPGHAVVFETSGHIFDPTVPTKVSESTSYFCDCLQGNILYILCITMRHQNFCSYSILVLF